MDSPTNISLPAEIRVENLEPEGRRYVLPRRQLGGAKWVALIPIGFGLIGVTFALGWFAPLLGMAQAGAPPFVIVVFGLFSIPIVGGAIGVPIAIGLAMLFGHSEIETRPDTLRTVERVGLLRWTRTRQTNCIRRLRVENANAKGRPGTTTFAPLDKLAAIRIEWDGVKPWLGAFGYPRTMLIPLAHDLSQQCHTDPADPFVANASPPAPLEVVEVPEKPGEQEQQEQPANSKIVMAEQPGGVTFNVPSQGLLRGSGGLFFFACLWCGFMAFMTIGLIFFNKAPRQQGVGEQLAMLGFLGLFWAVGIGVMLAAINMGRRRAGIAVADGRLSILKTGLFGSKLRSWSRDELLTVRVGSSGVEVNHKPVLELQIIPQDGQKFGLLGGRDVAELEWLATRLRQALAIESPDGGSFLADVAQQPTGSKVICEQLPGALTLSVPRAGLGRATLGYWAFALFWNGFIATFCVVVIFTTGGFLEALFPMAILGALGAAGIGLLGMAVHMTIRRAELAVAGDRLLVLQTGLLGKKRNEWGRDELAAVRAGPSGSSTNNKPLMQLQIVPKSGPQVGLLMGRDDRELAWIATQLRRALDLPAEPNEEAVERGAS